VHVLSVLGERKGDERSTSFVRAKFAAENNRHFRQKFGFRSKSEDIIGSYRCMQLYGLPTQFYVTTTSLCWCALLAVEMQKIILPLQALKSVKKDRSPLLKLDNSIRIISNDLQEHFLWGFLKRDDAYAVIMHQAKLNGNPLVSGENNPLVLAEVAVASLAGPTFSVDNEKGGGGRNAASRSFSDLMLKSLRHPAVMREKRDRKLRLRFGLPENEAIIRSLTCSLELAHFGKMTIADGHVCFSSKFPPVTMSIPFVDVQSIEKKKIMALVIPNALQVTTKTACHLFTAITKRDEIYLLLTDIWQMRRAAKSK